MRLLPGVRPLVLLLATPVLANPQAAAAAAALPPAPNGTAIAIASTLDPGASFRPHPESSVDGWGDQVTTAVVGGCDLPQGCSTSQMLVHVETSVTGFESLSSVMLQPIGGGAQTTAENRVDLVTTSTPSLVNIHTELAPTTQERAVEPTQTPAVGAGTTPGNSPTPGERPGDSPAPGESPTPENTPTPGHGPAPSEPQATSTPNDLLTEIVSQIGIPISSIEAGSQQADNSLPATSGTDLGQGDGPSHPSAGAQFQQATGAEPGPPVSPYGSVPAITAGGQITLGSATLTLTPGLSSVLGDGATATYVAITTDDVGQTLITVSSSGTAVTATITDSPATLTKTRTGVEASITTTPSLASGDGTSADRAAATTSSQGLGAHQRAELGQWLYAGVGLVGLGLVAG